MDETTDFASDLLYGFDVQDEESLDFLKSLIRSGQAPASELREMYRLSLLRGQEEWDMICACAGAVHARSVGNAPAADPGLVPYLAYVCAGQEERERLIAGMEEGRKKKEVKKRGPRKVTSRFWEGGKAGEEKSKSRSRQTSVKRCVDEKEDVAPRLPPQQTDDSNGEDPSLLLEATTPDANTVFKLESSPSSSSSPSPVSSPTAFHYEHHHHHHHQHTPRSRGFKSSPFFATTPTPKKPRPPRGTISSLPIPPLSSARFGLIQESLSHDPFRLLVAVTFLIRTAGKAAIPVFHSVTARFPTPGAFVEADLETELAPMIRQLGLAAVRCAIIGRYAAAWVAEETRPRPGRMAVVRGYPRRGGGESIEMEMEIERLEDAEGGPERDGVDESNLEADTPRRKSRSKLPCSEWEIGHLTQGPYAIDSWRIFCRDMFLGKSDSWMGREGDETFEPEWKRVMPDDKELRACLRWMWMREGYEWDPLTGAKLPLRDEMRDAVNEGRVGYDDTGGLIIIDYPRDGAGVGS